MVLRLNAEEVACLRCLAKRFESSLPDWTYNDVHEPLGASPEGFGRLIDTMAELGAITNLQKASECPGNVFSFTVAFRAVQLAREIDEEEKKSQEGKDIVELVKNTLRKHPWGGWMCVAGIAIVSLITALNQAVSLGKSLGIW